MINARVSVPTPRNESILSYAPGSPEKLALKEQLRAFSDEAIEIPLIIGGGDVTTGDLGRCILPHDHRHTLATYHKGNADTVHQAIEAAAQARPGWGRDAVGGTRGDLSQSRRSPGEQVPSDPECRDDAEPEQDGDAGRD